MTNEELWQTTLAQIQFNVSRANFATWFGSTKILGVKNGEVLVSVPNLFVREWLGNKYNTFILKALREIDSGIRNIEFIVQTNDEQAEAIQRRPSQQEPIEEQMQFQEFKVDQKTNLNPKYNFENFIIGGFNELAHAACCSVAEKPGVNYNPLFIYGGVGLGKTHLLQATGNKISQTFPNQKIRYATAERFISKIVESIKNHDIEPLKQKMAQLDVLIIDDVQFFAGKEKTQEEFFHIFNTLHQNQKQIILSSDRPPNAIPAIEERLKSRFKGGMIADISSPDVETRIAILKSKCEEKNINLDQNVLEYIAANVQKNIRELEGALNRLIVCQGLENKTNPSFTIEFAKKTLKNVILSPQKSTNFKDILQNVANFYDLNHADLLLETRRKEIVKPRQIAMYLLRTELNESYPSIGRRFGGKDHTTAIYAYEKINKQLEQNETLVNELNLIKQRIYSEI